MQDYRDEIKDFFALDKQLASELEYDIKKYNEQLAQEQELARQADVSGVAYRARGTQTAQVACDPPLQSALGCELSQCFSKPTQEPRLVGARPFGLLVVDRCVFLCHVCHTDHSIREASLPSRQAT